MQNFCSDDKLYFRENAAKKKKKKGLTNPSHETN